jgi:ATP-dependent DNA helicase UvrD/PcrA
MTLAENLNPEQLEAVNHFEGPLLVLAGAGSGKTRIIVHRIIRLLELGIPPGEIVAVTFTNKAAEEMRQRVERFSNKQVLTATYHSFCARILRESIHHLGYQSNFIIYDEEDSEKLISECLKNLGEKSDKSIIKPLRRDISHAKNNLLLPEKEDEEQDPVFLAAYALYVKKLKEYNALDFDDLLFLTVRLFQEHPEVLKVYQKRYSFILIDEYQDTNRAQYLVTKLLSEKHNNLFAVGDPDQSIYSWRGANIENILNFERDFPGAKIISLEQNYRSTNTILNAANAVIENNFRRYEKKLWSKLGEGEKISLYICETDKAEADFVAQTLLKSHKMKKIPFRECVVFYRTNSQSRTFEDALLREKIPYVIIGGISFYQRKEIKDVLALLRMVLSGNDYLSFLRTIAIPKRGIGESALTKITMLAESENLTIFDTALGLAQGNLPLKLSQKQRDGLEEYCKMILELRQILETKLPLNELLSFAIEKWNYLNYLKEDPDTFEERRENLAELISKAAEWESRQEGGSLESFLEELSLKGSADISDEKMDSVRLMTLHNGKGLEFSAVFLVGMEEELFPHINARDTPSGLEEERRLCYVGMTRAKQELYLTAARFRFLWGSLRLMRPSRFLEEIPPNLLSVHKPIEPHFDAANEGSFLPGTRVTHKDLGKGVIRKSSEGSLGLTYEVYFPEEKLTRTLIAKYAKLTIDE